MSPQASEPAAARPRAAAHPFDWLDMALGLLGVISGQPVILGGAVALYFARRSRAVAAALLRALDAPPALAAHRFTQALLPGAGGQETGARETATGSRRPGAGDRRPGAGDREQAAGMRAQAGTKGAREDAEAIAPLHRDLARLPRTLTIDNLLPWPRSPTALPTGVDPDGTSHWLDLTGDTLHIGLYGVSGAGKDSLLRLWFLTLATRNPPDTVQFAILDGKGDWLTPNLARLAHMRFTPAGGYGASGTQAILVGMAAIDREAQRRQQIITAAGYRTRERFVAATGIAMPLLVVIVTDGMDAVAGEVETLLTALVAKARALGVRVVVSMQTPSGKELSWRANLSTVLAGALTDGTQDAPALGVRDTRQMRYRPSALPPPATRPGVFVLRHGGAQHLIQAPYLDEATFDRMVATLPERVGAPTAAPARPAGDDARLLEQLLRDTPNAEDGSRAAERDETEAAHGSVPTLNEVERAIIRMELRKGTAHSTIVKHLPGYGGRLYQPYLAKVRQVQAELRDAT